jgi:hypothetical protein
MTTFVQNEREIVRFMYSEIVAMAEPARGKMEYLPSLGFVIWVSDDLVIHVTDRHRADGAYRLIQGEPHAIEPESLPFDLLLPHFKRAIERRLYLANKRIAKLVESLEAYDSIAKACHPLDLGALAKEIRAFQDSPE